MFNAIVDKVISSAIGIVTNAINNHDFSDTTTTVDNCATNVPPFSGVIGNAIKTLLVTNITQLIETYLVEQPALTSFTQFHYHSLNTY